MKNNVMQQDGKYYQECEVVMLPSNKSVTRIGYNRDRLGTNRLYYSEEGAGNQSQHLYIISNEEIKEGDWFISTEFDIIGQLLPTDIRGEEIIYKIIATTDESLGLPRPSNEFIQKYVELQGKIDKVLVEVIDIGNIDFSYNLKVAPDNTITIRPTEIKKDIFSREEVEELCRKAFQAGGSKYEAIYKYRNSNIESPEEIEKFDAVPSENKWIKENL